MGPTMNANQPLPDNELFALVKEGRQEAFSELYKRFFKPLFTHAVKRLGDDQEAMDIVQDLFEYIWVRKTELEIANFSAYLYAGIRNRIITARLKSSRRNNYLDSLRHFMLLGELITDYTVRERELKRLIEHEVDALPPQMKKVFKMSRVEGLSHKEIARQLGTSEQTVRTQIKRSLRILRSRLGIVVYLYILFYRW